MDLHTLMSFKWSIMGPEYFILGVCRNPFAARLAHAAKAKPENAGWIAIAAVFAAMALPCRI